MAKWSNVPDASAEVERLRVELEQARAQLREMALDVLAAEEAAEQAKAERDALIYDLERLKASETEQLNRADKLQAERDDLAARLQSIQQAERKYTAAKLTEAAKMRKGQAL